MKSAKLILFSVVFLTLASYFAYHAYLPIMVAKSITSDSVSVFMPTDLKIKIEKIKKPINKISKDVITEIHHSGITIDDVLKAIDEAKEEQALSLLAELNNTEIESTDQFFNLAKKHFPVNFDVEILRASFNAGVNVNQIRKGIQYADLYKDRDEIDVATAKSIVKRILLQNEKEFTKSVQKKTNR